MEGHFIAACPVGIAQGWIGRSIEGTPSMLVLKGSPFRKLVGCQDRRANSMKGDFYRWHNDAGPGRAVSRPRAVPPCARIRASDGGSNGIALVKVSDREKKIGLEDGTFDILLPRQAIRDESVDERVRNWDRVPARVEFLLDK